MRHTVLLALGLFLLSTLFRGNAQANQPQASLTVDGRVIPAGGRVTLTCSVEPSAGWRFYWFRGGSEFSTVQTVTSGTSSTSVSVSEGGIYHCRGGRGDQVFFTAESNAVTIEETVSGEATVILQTNWTQIFTGETITLRCEIQGGGGTQWTYEWEQDELNKPPTSREYRINGATVSDSGGYRCRGRSYYYLTKWSDTIRLTVSETIRRLVINDTSAIRLMTLLRKTGLTVQTVKQLFSLRLVSGNVIQNYYMNDLSSKLKEIAVNINLHLRVENS
ncbi:uncharacterized protein LOC125012817 [Mugil cephalus]|uniref:uncharacterized protein LOC125012817 n=1 Tax=Mugil cephalus TaxID=48193 RepID=UPI001FB5C545|nr:uncharacterized protein LOC125012817 [Mugil cephalus]